MSHIIIIIIIIIIISTWMSANMLKLNEENTELIIFNPKHQVRINEESRLQVGNNTVSVASSVKNLKAYFDRFLTMKRQVNAISRACYYQIRNIGHIRRYITLDNISARLRQRSPVWSSKHTDDTAIESTEFFCQVSHSHL